MTTIKKTIDGQRFEVNDLLLNFEIHHTPQSSYVAFFGLNREESKFFMQFNKDAAFIYDMPAEEQEDALAAESIGKFFHARIKNNYVGESIAALSVAPAQDDDEPHFADGLPDDDEEDDEDLY